jgi:hypothetical protein
MAVLRIFLPFVLLKKNEPDDDLQVDYVGENGTAEEEEEDEAVEHAVATAGPAEDEQHDGQVSEAVAEHKEEAGAAAGDEVEEDWGLDEEEPTQ